MNNIQEQILNEYKNKFPNDGLKEISLKTNIQLTRVFRLFNGSEMKLKEYEAFKNIIVDNKESRFASLANTCELSLSQNKLNTLMAYMKLAIKSHELLSSTPSYIAQDQQIQTA